MNAPGWLSFSRYAEVSAPLVALVVASPILVIAASVFSGESALIWSHLWDTVLADYVTNSVLLMLGVGVLTLILGVPAAWYTAVCEFPGRSVFVWALLLPLAFPAYIIAYTYTGLLEFAGPVQTLLRDLTGWKYGDYWFFPIHSLGGAILMLGLVLYPYVYLLTRTAFLERSTKAIEVSRTLGYSVPRSFFQLAIPLARPAIVAGISLALMETLADYGTVQYFGLSTFTTGIFRAFYGFDDLTAASQLSAALLAFIVLLIYLERYSRRKARYDTGGRSMHEHRIRLTGWQAAWAWLGCLAPVLLGFIVPAAILLKWALRDARWEGASFLSLMWNSFYLAFLAAVIAVTTALVLGYAKRTARTRPVRLSVDVSGLGYAIPGAIIAVGVIVPLAWLDHRLIGVVRFLSGEEMGLLLVPLGHNRRAPLRLYRTVPRRLARGGAGRSREDQADPRLRRALTGPSTGRGLAADPRAAAEEHRAHRPPHRVRRRPEGAPGHPDPPALQFQHPCGEGLRACFRRAAG